MESELSDQDADAKPDKSPYAGEIHSATLHGTVASHKPRDVQPLLLAPTTTDDFNAIALDLVSVACLSLHDILFEFDSSFPLPVVAKMLDRLPALRELHKNKKGEFPLLSLFGHADPVGGDIYNKLLSGRRARAIYGLLTHDSGIWSQLYHEEWHSKNALKTMRQVTGLSPEAPNQQVFEAYMALQFPGKLEKKDFLGRGADEKGRADFQGCSDFNPLVILSTKENSSLPKDERNIKNQANRRVLIYLFRPGSKVNVDLWPCPAAEDSSIEQCRARFFGPPKTGDLRRKAGPERREFANSGDTFGCRFYNRIGGSSPCEKPVEIITITIRLFNVDHKPMKGLKYELLIGSETFSGETNDQGILSHQVAAGVEKGKLKLPMWSADVVIAPVGAPDSSQGIAARLENLGYHAVGAAGSGFDGDEAADMALMRFQSAYDEPVTGHMNDATKKRLVDRYGY